MVTILSVDGGGIRGIIPATVLSEVERRTGRPIAALFDLVAGTSTGGILAAMLTVPDGLGQPRYTAQEALAAYLEHGGAIFRRNPLRQAATLGGLIRPTYSPRALERMLDRYLGQARLHATLTEILVTAYDMDSATPWFFKTSFARQHRGPLDDPLLSQVVRATTAAPTYFPPLALEGRCLVDGGVFASNPALCAYAEARNMYPGERDFLLLSLGTGLQEHVRPCAQVENWGIIKWAVPISGVMLNASSATVDYQLRALLGPQSYLRCQVQLVGASPDMDDASPENLRCLAALGEQTVRQNEADLNRFCRALVERERQPARQNRVSQGEALRARLGAFASSPLP